MDKMKINKKEILLWLLIVLPSLFTVEIGYKVLSAPWIIALLFGIVLNLSMRLKNDD